MNPNVIISIIQDATQEVVPCNIDKKILLQQARQKLKQRKPKTEIKKFEQLVERATLNTLEELETGKRLNINRLEDYYDLNSYSGITFFTEQVKNIYKRQLHYYYLHIRRKNA